MGWPFILLASVAAQSPMGDAITPWNTCFQTPEHWEPVIDIQSDTVLAYGVWGDFAARVASWAAQGYQVEMMTGVAWGEYQDFVEGRFDGTVHHDHAQVQRDGQPIMHHATVPYFVPSAAYRAYLKTLLAKAIDAGVTGIHLEEPEFWARGGYSEAFQREFARFYGRPWEPPHASVNARYHAERLKYELYRETLAELFEYAKTYARSQGRSVRCYVPTHTLINYASWRIVSPMSSLMALPHADGYIAQVWTGTARTPNVYRGALRSRTFETAYLEYAQAVSMIRPTGRTCILLADPVEDDANHGWDDYEDNYKRVLAASLLHPEVSQYEVMPWPKRVFAGHYPANEADARRRDESAPPPRVPMPSRYATVLLACINALNEMNPEGRTEWNAGPDSIGVVVSDTLMFQRDEPSPSDPHLSSFFGLAMPLLKHGIPVKVVQLETVTNVEALRGLDLLLLTYEGMKPPQAQAHEVLATWVRDRGGALLFVDDGRDPYHEVRSWWNESSSVYAHPGQHLLERLGVERDAAPGVYLCGNGVVQYASASPAALAYRQDGAEQVRAWARALYGRAGKGRPWTERSSLVLRRGRYVVAAAMDESVDAAGTTVSGDLVDLFDADLPVRRDPVLLPGQVGLFVDARGTQPSVLASASRIRNVTVQADSLTYDSRGPSGTTCISRLWLPRSPTRVLAAVAGVPVPVTHEWDDAFQTVKVTYANCAEAVTVQVGW